MIARTIDVAGVVFRFEAENARAGDLLDRRFGAFARPDSPSDDATRVRLELEGSQPEVAYHDMPLGLSLAPGGGLIIEAPRLHAEISADDRRATLVGPLSWQPLDAVVRLLLARRLLERGGLLVHASAVEWGGRAAVFVGPSGAGKSTIGRLLPGRLLSDDAVVLAHDPQAGVIVQATPYWRGRPFSAPLSALLFIRRGAAVSWGSMQPALATARLLRATGPLVPEERPRALGAAAALVLRAPARAEVTLATLDDVVGWLHPRLERLSDSSWI